ncbi:MAG: type VI secretion system-associated FHA domain protein TagH [Candidatus Thiodiazotropha sp. (ex Dulcina madagascariensis)]|nr:type VI secretion system-associated FHA domain protein TagH [Candidatus Thiodiazotropha sp. (ex Dulcina madagascariensis)]MCU7927984.1 type VI secretion system-associated FHA domain protein TagH [Candidatus Thiodiazotropha sp. (ex Dulcina madagascariensis)]
MLSDSQAMKLNLEVTRIAGTPPASDMSVTFDQQGGSIGRREENDWVLPDPERFISGRHAQIDFSDGDFHLTDVSSNGVFLNRAAKPLGKDNRVALQDGDTISIGDYEISVTLQKPAVPSAESKAFDGLDDPFAQMVDESAGQELEQAFSTSPVDTLQPEQVPEAAYSLEEQEPPSLDTDESSLEIAQTAPSSQADHTSDLNAYFNQPTPIPEDWDLDNDVGEREPEQYPDQAPEILPPLTDEPLPEPQASPPIQAEKAAPPVIPQESIPRPGRKAGESAPVPPRPPLEKPVTTPTAPSDEAALRRALAQGMNIPESHFDDRPLPELLENLGQVLRSSVDGTMSILRARAQMKGEFRMSQTMIQPVENNPLKFSINIEEALRHIVNPSPSSGYLTPLTAFKEAHEDIEAHMLAVMVGMQAALQVVLQRFKPEILEKRLGQPALLEKLPLYKQAKTWELFTELYTEIATEAEDDFHQLFGRTFSQAYEEQIRRLESLKRSDPGLPN